MTALSFGRMTAREPSYARARDGGASTPSSLVLEPPAHGRSRLRAAASVPGRRRQALAHLVDLLADGRRSLRARARDGVRVARGVRRDLLADVQPHPAGARERRHPRLAHDDVLRRALLHAPAPRRHARDVERAARDHLLLGVEPHVPARHRRRCSPGTVRDASTASSSGRSTSRCSSSGARTS